MKILFLVLMLITSISSFCQSTDSLSLGDTAVFNRRQQMSTVVVKSAKPFIEKKVDKTVLNIKNDIVASGGNVFEALQRAPGVSVQNDESISMSGKTGVNVYIDGRPSQMTEKDLAAYLKSMPASLVDRIELITNPQARYDAQGNAGIINIILKKNTVRGTNGNLNAAYTQSNHYRTDITGNINHRRGGLNLFGNVSTGKVLQHTKGIISKAVQSGNLVKNFENSSIDKDASSQFGFITGADFMVNKQKTFGILLKFNNYSSPMLTPGTTLIKSQGKVDSSLISLNNNKEERRRGNINFNYRYEDTVGTVFNIDADYVSFNNRSSSDLSAELRDNENMLYGITANDQNVKTSITIKGLKADFSKVIKSFKAKLDIGAKLAMATTKNDLQASYLTMNGIVPDSGRTNQFRYNEDIYAAYINMSRETGKWQYQGGLRLENAQVRGFSEDLSMKRIDNPDTSYTHLFPSLFIRYQVSKFHQLGLSVSSRINRPGYQDLNPFEYQYDNYSSHKGNPYLQPEYSKNIELNYSYKSVLDVSLGYSGTRNFFQSISSQIGERTQATEFNVGKEASVFINASLNNTLTKWWDSYLNLSPFYKEYRGKIPSGSINTDSYGMSWYASQRFNLGKGYQAQLSSWGNIATKDALFRTRSLGSMDMGFSKSILKQKLSLRLTALDVLNTQRWKQEVNFSNMNFIYSRKWESRGLRLQVNWKFGRTNFKDRERNTGTDSETSRIKEK